MSKVISGHVRSFFVSNTYLSLLLNRNQLEKESKKVNIFHSVWNCLKCLIWTFKAKNKQTATSIKVNKQMSKYKQTAEMRLSVVAQCTSFYTKFSPFALWLIFVSVLICKAWIIKEKLAKMEQLFQTKILTFSGAPKTDWKNETPFRVVFIRPFNRPGDRQVSSKLDGHAHPASQPTRLYGTAFAAKFTAASTA